VDAIQYSLPAGTSALYPPVGVLAPNPPSRLFPPFEQPGVPFTSLKDVIKHYTLSSLQCEGFQTISAVSVSGADTIEDPFRIALHMEDSEYKGVWAFGQAHQAFLHAAFKALHGASRMRKTSAWNPMSGFQVNESDGLCEWALCLPLGMAMLRQRAVTLMHYPPYIAMQHGDYLFNNTLSRWQNLLLSCGVQSGALGSYTTIVDVNPIAAPGSGQSEYPNDYFPIMMSSVFFDDASTDSDYIRTMLGTLLNVAGKLPGGTLPLLVCGAPTYDPQAPGWFRVAYKDQLPAVKTQKYPDLPGIVQANVMQVGTVRLAAGAPPTPYMLANHMIAASVIGRMTGVGWASAADLPDIRQFEAQDLVAAEFVRIMGDDPCTDPNAAKTQACQRWYGNATGTGVPVPPAAADKASLCALAIVDTYFNLTTIQPWYTLPQATEMVQAAIQQHGQDAYNPCRQDIYPPPAGSDYKTGICVGCPEAP
jgi:hypothetical protein